MTNLELWTSYLKSTLSYASHFSCATLYCCKIVLLSQTTVSALAAGTGTRKTKEFCILGPTFINSYRIPLLPFTFTAKNPRQESQPWLSCPYNEHRLVDLKSYVVQTLKLKVTEMTYRPTAYKTGVWSIIARKMSSLM